MVLDTHLYLPNIPALTNRLNLTRNLRILCQIPLRTASVGDHEEIILHTQGHQSRRVCECSLLDLLGDCGPQIIGEVAPEMVLLVGSIESFSIRTESNLECSEISNASSRSVFGIKPGLEVFRDESAF
jgi:hypothetical protein